MVIRPSEVRGNIVQGFKKRWGAFSEAQAVKRDLDREKPKVRRAEDRLLRRLEVRSRERRKPRRSSFRFY